MSLLWHIRSLGFSMNTNRLPSDNSQERKIRFKIDPLYEMSNSYSEKAHPSSIFTRFNTHYVIHLFSYTDSLFAWSQAQNRESTKGYSRWKVEQRHGKFEASGLNKWSTSKSHNGGRNQVSGSMERQINRNSNI